MISVSLPIKPSSELIDRSGHAKLCRRACNAGDAAHTGLERVRDRVRIRDMVSIRATKYGHPATHFDDPQTQTVEERVISTQVA